MAYRYCPECGRWLETGEYVVDDIGETVCPTHDVAVHGHIASPSGRGFGNPLSQLKRQTVVGDEEIDAAYEQGLIDRKPTALRA